MKKLMLPIFATIATTSISSQLLLNINNQSVLTSDKILFNQEQSDTAIKLNYARAIFQKYTEEFSKHKSEFKTLAQQLNEKWSKIMNLNVIPKNLSEKQQFLQVALDYLKAAEKQVNNIIAFKSKHLALQPQELKNTSFEEVKEEIQEHLNELDPRISNDDAKLTYIIRELEVEGFQFLKIDEMLEIIYQHNNKKYLEFNLPNLKKLPLIFAQANNDLEESQRLDEAKAIFERFSNEYNIGQENLKTTKMKFNEFWKEDLKYQDLKKLSKDEKGKCIDLARNYLNEMDSKWNNIKNLKQIHEALLPTEIRSLTMEKIDSIQKQINVAISQLSVNHKNVNSKLTYILEKRTNFNEKADNLLVNMELIAEHNHYKWDNFDK